MKRLSFLLTLAMAVTALASGAAAAEGSIFGKWWVVRIEGQPDFMHIQVAHARKSFLTFNPNGIYMTNIDRGLQRGAHFRINGNDLRIEPLQNKRTANIRVELKDDPDFSKVLGNVTSSKILGEAPDEFMVLFDAGGSPLVDLWRAE